MKITISNTPSIKLYALQFMQDVGIGVHESGGAVCYDSEMRKQIEKCLKRFVRDIFSHRRITLEDEIQQREEFSKSEIELLEQIKSESGRERVKSIISARKKD